MNAPKALTSLILGMAREVREQWNEDRDSGEEMVVALEASVRDWRHLLVAAHSRHRILLIDCDACRALLALEEGSSAEAVGSLSDVRPASRSDRQDHGPRVPPGRAR